MKDLVARIPSSSIPSLVLLFERVPRFGRYQGGRRPAWRQLAARPCRCLLALRRILFSNPEPGIQRSQEIPTAQP